jgi:alkanesulfonate monooxygenase SsuD/methylene tetrahydromethanopterin reductase-like flavin-dependent oxidoreductase (luciferase family)
MKKAPLRELTLIAFLQAQNCSNYARSWRHAESMPDFMTAEYYQRIARTLEDGKFQLAFFDDRLAMPDRYADDAAEALRHGIRVVKLDLVPLMTAMGLATRHLGIGGTYSTTDYEPFHVARVYATLDHLLGGRAAWNVVTSLNDSEAANFGQASHLEHDARYDRADEFMAVVLGHWDSREDDTRLHPVQRPRLAARASALRRQSEGGRRRGRRVVREPRLRRIRGGCDARARRLRGVRAPGDARAPAPAPVPARVQGNHPA